MTAIVSVLLAVFSLFTIHELTTEPAPPATVEATQTTPDLVERAQNAETASRTQIREDVRFNKAPEAFDFDAKTLVENVKAIVALKPALNDAQATLDAQQQQSSNTPSAPVSSGGAALPTSGGCVGLNADLAMICQHASGGNPRAYNPTGCLGGCYGLFQMAGEYMDTWAQRAGYPQYAYAGFWPVEIQHAVAMDMYSQPNGMEIYWCQWTDYC